MSDLPERDDTGPPDLPACECGQEMNEDEFEQHGGVCEECRRRLSMGKLSHPYLKFDARLTSEYTLPPQASYQIGIMKNSCKLTRRATIKDIISGVKVEDE
jgi:hypothetical protein